MPQIQTVLQSHSSNSGSNSRGGWTLHVFKAVNGDEFKTFDAGIGNKAFGLMNQPVTVEYGEKPAKDPKYGPDKILQGITATEGAPAVQAPPVAVAPTQTAPTTDDRQIQIMRQSALERAIRYYDAQPKDGFTTDDIYALADEFVDYFVNGRVEDKVAVAAVADDGFPLGF